VNQEAKMARSRRGRRDDDEEDSGRSRRRRSSGFATKLIVLFLVGFVLLATVPLFAVGGYLLYRYTATGASPVPALPSLTYKTRDRLIGKWQMPVPNRPGLMLQEEFRQDGSLIVSDSANSLPPILSTYDVIREGKDSIQLRVKSNNDPQNPVEWDIQFVGDSQFQVTSSAPDTPVRTFTRVR
jgi:hypothetical protein